MPNSAQIAAALYGAWRLLRLDRGGLAFFEQTPEGFYRSFYAALLVAPGYIILILIHLADVETQASGLRILTVETIAYVISWTAFPLIMFRVTDAIGRGNAYIVFVVAFNWSKVIHMLIFLPIAAISFGGLLPDGFMTFLSVVASIGILAYQWFVTRTALDISGMGATGLVLLDVIIGIVIKSVSDGMIT